MLRSLNGHEVDRLRREALATVLRQHTYAHRASTILTELGLPHSRPDATLTMIARVDSISEIAPLVSRFAASQRPDDKLLIQLSTSMNPLDVAQAYREYMNAHVSVISAKFIPSLETSHLLLIGDEGIPGRDRMNELMLHAAYLDDTWLRVGSTGTFQVWESAPMENVIGPAARIGFALSNRGREVGEGSCSV